MLCFGHDQKRRHGAIVPLFAILLIPLLGMLAFSIDIGYLTLVKTDLQNAADAAALAGAEKLQDLYVQYTLPAQQSNATILTAATTNKPGSPMNVAERFASYNKVGNVSLAVRDQDVSFGFTDAQGVYHRNGGDFRGADFPNSITVITRRDSIQNNPVSLFFGPVLGLSSKELSATATATIYSGDVNSLQVLQGVNGHILPVALDVNVWTTFYATGLSPDNTIHTAANGLPELHIYPTPGNAPGNFGLLDIGPPANNVPAFRSWIDYGETPNDINYLLGSGLLPVSLSSPKNWKGGPGMKSTLQTDFNSQMGVPNLIPLFLPVSAPAGMQALSTGSYQAASGNGSNTYYAIVGFAGCAISNAVGRGSNMDISIQPCAVLDPTAVISSPFRAKPAGAQISQFGSSTIITTFVSAKLTR